MIGPTAIMKGPSMSKIVPYLSYADAPAAIEFLTQALGFEERMRYPMDDGRVGHAELALGDSLLMLASAYPELGFTSPQQLEGLHGQVYCEVDDVDAHHAVARAAGATIAKEPADEHGARQYRLIDPEGHRWIFSSPAADAS